MGEGFYQALEDNNISYLKGDWTHKDPEITALLNQYNRNGVPLYLLFAKDSGSAEILPQFLTTAILIEALESIN
jgi:thiol:disulfide interchange protein DsbD